MSASLKTVELSHLALAFIPVAVVIAIYYRWSLNYKNTLYALARMLLQLSLIHI